MSLEGNRPKKFQRKTNLHNPTLQSLNVTSLFNPELYSQLIKDPKFVPQRKQLFYASQKNQNENNLRSKQQSINKNQQLNLRRSQSPLERRDSLEKAQQQYNNRKNEKIVNPHGVAGYSTPRAQYFWNNYQEYPQPRQDNPPTPNQMSMSIYNRRLNYLDSNSIKKKQLHGFNILSNF